MVANQLIFLTIKPGRAAVQIRLRRICRTRTWLLTTPSHTSCTGREKPRSCRPQINPGGRGGITRGFAPRPSGRHACARRSTWLPPCCRTTWVLTHPFPTLNPHARLPCTPPCSKSILAEGVGFEPTKGFPLPVFKTGAFNRSATLPSWPTHASHITTHVPCAAHCARTLARSHPQAISDNNSRRAWCGIRHAHLPVCQ